MAFMEDIVCQPVDYYGKFSSAGPYLSAVADILARSDGLSPLKNDTEIQATGVLASEYREMIKKSSICKEEVKKALYKYYWDTAETRAEADVIKSIWVDTYNPYGKILCGITGPETRRLEEYEVPVTGVEMDMMHFWFSLPEEKLQKMSEVIVRAFLHGFISQGRDRKGRRRVRFQYQVGQEALALQVLKELKDNGLVPVILKPGTSVGIRQIDEKQSRVFESLLDRALLEHENEAWEAAVQNHSEELHDVCGMIVIGQFGEIDRPIDWGMDSLDLSSEAKALTAERNSYRRDVESVIVKPSELSFCKITFPNCLVGDRFPSIFRDFWALNMQESAPYEMIQKTLIDTLDQCVGCRIIGNNGNETNLSVAFFGLDDPHTQTKFLNCGGDLNIPYGEVFTTPKLSGTSGLIHVPVITLQGKNYHNLRICFRDGWIQEASCDEGQHYILENLLNPEPHLTIGEFAIGTNTRAYSLSEKYSLGGVLPILINEKTGPHIAIGDPCFAYAEDAPIYNLQDHKEMICRENERTKRRQSQSVYFGKHVDITLPYKEIMLLAGIKENGDTIDIIREGRFVLSGTEGLNEGFHPETREGHTS